MQLRHGASSHQLLLQEAACSRQARTQEVSLRVASSVSDPACRDNRSYQVGRVAGADRSCLPSNRPARRPDGGGATSAGPSAEPSLTTGCEKRRASPLSSFVPKSVCSRRTPMQRRHVAGTRTDVASSPALPGKLITTARCPTSSGTPNRSPRGWRGCLSPRLPRRSVSRRRRQASSAGGCGCQRLGTGQRSHPLLMTYGGHSCQTERSISSMVKCSQETPSQDYHTGFDAAVVSTADSLGGTAWHGQRTPFSARTSAGERPDVPSLGGELRSDRS